MQGFPTVVSESNIKEKPAEFRLKAATTASSSIYQAPDKREASSEILSTCGGLQKLWESIANVSKEQILMIHDELILKDLKERLAALKAVGGSTSGLLKPFKCESARFLILNPAEITNDPAVLHVARALVIVVDEAVTDAPAVAMRGAELNECFGPDQLNELASGDAEPNFVKVRFSEVEKIF